MRSRLVKFNFVLVLSLVPGIAYTGGYPECLALKPPIGIPESIDSDEIRNCVRKHLEANGVGGINFISHDKLIIYNNVETGKNKFAVLKSELDDYGDSSVLGLATVLSQQSITDQNQSLKSGEGWSELGRMSAGFHSSGVMEIVGQLQARSEYWGWLNWQPLALEHSISGTSMDINSQHFHLIRIQCDTN